jgi:hypothetical protein
MKEKQAFMLRRREPNHHLSYLQVKIKKKRKIMRSAKRGYGLKNCC